MDLSAPGLDNQMLRFEPIDVRHRDYIFDSEIEKSVWKWMPALQGGTSLKNYFDAIIAMQKCGQSATFVLFRQDDNAFAGVTGFTDINKIHRRVRNALAWHPPEMATMDLYQAGQLAMIERAHDWRAKRLEWQVNPENDFMTSMVATLQPTREATFRNFERTADGVWVDKVVFAFTRTEMTEAIVRLKRDLFAT
ncbi:MAG: GNAT family protein [Pseudomonadota bacterium]